MPKIIENLQARLAVEAKKQVEESGYAAMTIRSVAKACGVGVGTVYNYYSSKDEILASYMLEDWNKCVAAINAVSTYSDSPAPVVRCICDQLCFFARLHAAVVRDEAAAAVFSGAHNRYHGVLRGQLAAPLRKFCDTDFAAEFIAEGLLTWTLSDREFDEIYGMIRKLFKE
ncbi:MAG: TetR/AcrR family transcriptional regulator [Oscillospiraceae bacterium]|nr:TetR/AcrR family transcriptional regulator [Oscillospiraceae bacterium]